MVELEDVGLSPVFLLESARDDS